MTEQEFQIELWDLFCKGIEEKLMPTQVLFSLKFCEVRFKKNILEILEEQGPKLTEIWLAESEVLSKIDSMEAFLALCKEGDFIIEEGEVH
tara:strand:+ start:262 stop:534 length:273 start_codon:yes stop_codon:yes gene_type:complete